MRVTARLFHAGVAVRRAAGDYSLLNRGTRIPHQEPAQLSQRNAGDFPQPGASGGGVDGRLQGDLLPAQPASGAVGPRRMYSSALPVPAPAIRSDAVDCFPNISFIPPGS